MGPLPLGKGQTKFFVVAVDYFTKWAEGEVLATITEKKITDFVWKSLLSRFGVPHVLITNNGWQFNNAAFQKFCDELNIKNYFTSPMHLQANGQVKAINKLIKWNLKTKLEDLKGSWAEELPKLLWAYRITPRTSIGEITFSLAFEAKAFVPVEIGLSSPKVEQFVSDEKEQALRMTLELLKEHPKVVYLRMVEYKNRIARYYNSMVHTCNFKEGDLVLRWVMPNTRDPTSGTLGPS